MRTKFVSVIRIDERGRIQPEISEIYRERERREARRRGIDSTDRARLAAASRRTVKPGRAALGFVL